ncbi:helix-turn-helix domain-containing protein [Actinomadura macrotermitis]|uniref:HTH merR-type domain-containing protein n=1 Tax=Actinomadura macrotermitis TaxID=2585200 RepID=A0A7K0BZ38_9ACTN|nr:MerR family transcriptional regulator [Actinomadura macrotermitis]MQY05924.1 hypothetical protein [Actinomadura macrotermitis]
MDVTWTIGELAEHASAALADGAAGRLSGRVRDQPNERLIRWYTTIGLLDPPLGRRGRVALYGPRHLLQLVAIKRRQALGRSIAEIQVELTGATDTTLERIAALPPTAPSGTPPTSDAPAGQPSAPAPRRAAAGSAASNTPANPTTGTTPPTERSGGSPGTPTGASTGQAPEAREPQAGESQAERARFWASRPDVSFPKLPVALGGENPPAAGPSLVQGVRLAPDVTVLLDGAALSPDDLAAIEEAARPLLHELRRRGLIASPPPTDAHAHPPSDATAGRPQ